MVKEQMFKFEELRVYKEALNFVDLVYVNTNHWPNDEVFGITIQFRRAAVSIVLNLAEGTSRPNKDFTRFLDMARGSCYECAAILSIVKSRGYLDVKIYEQMYKTCVSLSKMISALKKSIPLTNNQLTNNKYE
jgi:four helix bundle protein